MRAVSFVGLHRMLAAIARSPGGLRASEINKLVLDKQVVLISRDFLPKPTTLYHYRNTLLRLGALQRKGRKLIAAIANPHVYNLLNLPSPPNADRSLTDAARESFASLVVNNSDCRALFFDLFMSPNTRSTSVCDFRTHGSPVDWIRDRSPSGTVVVLRNPATEQTTRCRSHASIAAVLYGIRYWARDELRLVDEYRRVVGGTVMFPLMPRAFSGTRRDPAVRETIRLLLSLRAPGEWAFFSVLDLIERCCERRRQPLSVLFDALDDLLRQWPHDVVLIPTSQGLATLTAKSRQEANLVLRRYYTHGNGPYISHIRIHRNVTADPWRSSHHHVQSPSEAQA